MTYPQILLASSSPYRQQQLRQLGLSFAFSAPAIDESPLPGEKPYPLAERLAQSKAAALAPNYPGHIVIAGDQTATFDGISTLGKPGTLANATHQLTACSGKTVSFFSSLCVLSAVGNKRQTRVIETKVKFRQLSDEQIRMYLLKEEPFDCAGSFKCEGLGIALFESIHSEDPSALIGLPLIALTSCLSFFNIDVLQLR